MDKDIGFQYLYASKEGPTQYFFTAPIHEPPNEKLIFKLANKLYLHTSSQHTEECDLQLLTKPGHLSRCGKEYKLRVPQVKDEAREFDEMFQASSECRFSSPWSDKGVFGLQLAPEWLVGKEIPEDVQPRLPILTVPDDLSVAIRPERVGRLAPDWVILSGPQGSTLPPLPLLVMFKEPVLPKTGQELKVGAFNPFARTTDENLADEVTLAANTLLTALMLVCQGCMPSEKFFNSWVTRKDFNIELFSRLTTNLHIPASVVLPLGPEGQLATREFSMDDYLRISGIRTVKMRVYRLNHSRTVTTQQSSELAALEKQIKADMGNPTPAVMTKLRAVTSSCFTKLRKRLNDALLDMGTTFDDMKLKFAKAIKNPAQTQPISDLLKQLYTACNTVASDLYIWAIELMTGGRFTFSDLVEYMKSLAETYPEIKYYCDVTDWRNKRLFAVHGTKLAGSLETALPMTKPENLRELMGEEDTRLRLDDRFFMAQTCRYLIPETGVNRERDAPTGIMATFGRLKTQTQDLVTAIKGEGKSIDQMLSQLFISYRDILGTATAKKDEEQWVAAKRPHGLAHGGARGSRQIHWVTEHGVSSTWRSFSSSEITKFRKCWDSWLPLMADQKNVMTWLSSYFFLKESFIPGDSTDRTITRYLVEAVNPSSKTLGILRESDRFNLPYLTITPQGGQPWPTTHGNSSAHIISVGANEGLVVLDPTHSNTKKVQAALLLATGDQTAIGVRNISLKLVRKGMDLESALRSAVHRHTAWSAATEGKGLFYIATASRTELQVWCYSCTQTSYINNNTYQSSEEPKIMTVNLSDVGLSAATTVSVRATSDDKAHISLVLANGKLLTGEWSPGTPIQWVRYPIVAPHASQAISESAFVPGTDYLLAKCDNSMVMLYHMSPKPVLIDMRMVPESATMCALSEPLSLAYKAFIAKAEVGDLLSVTSTGDHKGDFFVFGRHAGKVGSDQIVLTRNWEPVGRLWLHQDDAAYKADFYSPLHDATWVISGTGLHIPLIRRD